MGQAPPTPRADSSGPFSLDHRPSLFYKQLVTKGGRMIDSALAGHAGDAGNASLMPHEMMGALVLVAILGIVTLIVGLAAVWLLIRIDRRLRAVAKEPRFFPHNPPPPSHRD